MLICHTDKSCHLRIEMGFGKELRESWKHHFLLQFGHSQKSSFSYPRLWQLLLLTHWLNERSGQCLFLCPGSKTLSRLLPQIQYWNWNIHQSKLLLWHLLQVLFQKRLPLGHKHELRMHWQRWKFLQLQHNEQQ